MGFSIALIAFSLLLMLLVLMHKGKGGGLSDMFGGGMQSSVGGLSVAKPTSTASPGRGRSAVVGVRVEYLVLLMKLDS